MSNTEEVKKTRSEELCERLSDILKDGYAPDLVQLQLMVLLNGGTPTGNLASKVRSASLLPEPTPVERIWRFCIYPATVTLMIGETGAGKSSVIYNMVLSAANNEPCFDIPFEREKPVRVLYIDPENAGQTCLQRLSRIGKGRPVELHFHSGEGVDLSNDETVAELKQFLIEGQYDMLVLDPLAQVFNTVNENDNSEAQRQMNALTRLSRQTGAAVIAVHHTGKDSTGNYGRGATSRLAAADVAFMLRARGRQDEESDDTFSGETISREDIVRLQVVKNRIEGRGSIYLQMAGQDKFLRSSFAAWKDAGAKNADCTGLSEARSEIMGMLASGDWYTRAEIYATLAQNGFGQAVCDEALKGMTYDSTASMQKAHGVYRYILTSYLYDAAANIVSPGLPLQDSDSDADLGFGDEEYD